MRSGSSASGLTKRAECACHAKLLWLNATSKWAAVAANRKVVTVVIAARTAVTLESVASSAIVVGIVATGVAATGVAATGVGETVATAKAAVIAVNVAIAEKAATATANRPTWAESNPHSPFFTGESLTARLFCRT